MSKQILPNELAEIVTGLLVAPDVLGELDSPEKHQSFMLAVGEVVAEHCGGHVRGVNDPDMDDIYLAEPISVPTFSVEPDDRLPSVANNVWAYYDLFVWDPEDVEGLEVGTPMTLEAIEQVRSRLQTALVRSATSEDNSFLKSLEWFQEVLFQGYQKEKLSSPGSFLDAMDELEIYIGRAKLVASRALLSDRLPGIQSIVWRGESEYSADESPVIDLHQVEFHGADGLIFTMGGIDEVDLDDDFQADYLADLLGMPASWRGDEDDTREAVIGCADDLEGVLDGVYEAAHRLIVDDGEPNGWLCIDSPSQWPFAQVAGK